MKITLKYKNFQNMVNLRGKKQESVTDDKPEKFAFRFCLILQTGAYKSNFEPDGNVWGESK